MLFFRFSSSLFTAGLVCFKEMLSLENEIGYTAVLSGVMKKEKKLIMGHEVLESVLAAKCFLSDDGHTFVLKTICQL